MAAEPHVFFVFETRRIDRAPAGMPWGIRFRDGAPVVQEPPTWWGQRYVMPLRHEGAVNGCDWAPEPSAAIDAFGSAPTDGEAMLMQDVAVERTSIPTLELSELRPERRDEALVRLAAAFQSHGYLLVHGHGVEGELFADVYELTEALFALPEEAKRRCAPPEARGLAGYVLGDPNERAPSEEETTEMWQIQRPFEDASGRHPAIPDNVWPDELPQLRAPALALFGALDGCALRVLEAIDEALELGDEGLTEDARDGWAILRLMRYPRRAERTPLDRPRAAAHDDMCLLTCYTGGSRAGLEVMLPDGGWAPVPPGERWLLVGAGSMLQAATNGLVRAATHRVVHRQDDPEVRYATPFFLLPRPDASMGPRPSLIPRSGSVPRYPARTAAQMLGMATGWGDDPAVKEHERWRTSSPEPDPRVDRVRAEGDSRLRHREIEIARIDQASDAAQRIVGGELELLVIRRAFAPEQMQALAAKLEAGDPPLSRQPFPEKFHASFLGGNLDMSGGDLDGYLDLAERFERDADRLLDEGSLRAMLPSLLASLGCGRPLARPRGPDGRTYLLASIREIREGGYIPPHCELEQLQRSPYADLGPRLDPTTLLSFYVMVRPPEEGGELAIHQLSFDEVRAEHVRRGRTEVTELLERLRRPRLVVRPRPGDLLLFDGGRWIHEVRPVGRGTRWTMGGFLGSSVDRSTWLHWA